MHPSPLDAANSIETLEIIKSHTIKRPRKWQNSRKCLPPDLQKTVASLFIIESSPRSSTYQGTSIREKVKKNFNLSDGSRLAENSLLQPPTYLRNIETGESKKKILISGKVPCSERNLDLNPLLI
jgi:hypothetical protein